MGIWEGFGTPYAPSGGAVGLARTKGRRRGVEPTTDPGFDAVTTIRGRRPRMRYVLHLGSIILAVTTCSLGDPVPRSDSSGVSRSASHPTTSGPRTVRGM